MQKSMKAIDRPASTGRTLTYEIVKRDLGIDAAESFRDAQRAQSKSESRKRALHLAGLFTLSDSSKGRQ